jgi:MFS family permease
LIKASLVFGVCMSFAALAPALAFELIALALVGFASVSFLSMANSTLQLGTDPQMRGRVMALWAVAFMGSTPIGGPLIGWITSVAGARVGLGVGAASCLVAGVIGWLTIRHYRETGTALSVTHASEADHIDDERLQPQTTPYDGQKLDS